MPNYSMPRRIWRIVYPPLIYLGTSVVVVFVAAIVYAVYLAVGIAADSGIVDAEYIFDDLMGFMMGNVMLFQLIACIICLLIFVPMWKKTSTMMPQFSGTEMNAKTIALTVFAGIGINLLISSIIDIANLTELFPSYEGIVEALTGGNMLVSFLAAAIAAPIVEELCFRGIVFGRLLYWMPLWAAIVIQSALFGLSHLNVIQSSYAFIIGTALSLLYIKFRNIWLPIIGHMAINSINYLFEGVSPETGVQEVSSWFFLIPSALVLGVCAWLLAKQPPPVAIIPEPAEIESAESGDCTRTGHNHVKKC